MQIRRRSDHCSHPADDRPGRHETSLDVPTYRGLVTPSLNSPSEPTAWDVAPTKEQSLLILLTSLPQLTRFPSSSAFFSSLNMSGSLPLTTRMAAVQSEPVSPHLFSLPSPVNDFQLMYSSGVTSKDRCARRSLSSRRLRGRASRFSSSLSSGFRATRFGYGSSHLRFGVTAGGSISRPGSRRTRRRWRRSGVPARPTTFGCVVLPSSPRRCTP